MLICLARLRAHYFPELSAACSGGVPGVDLKNLIMFADEDSPLKLTIEPPDALQWRASTQSALFSVKLTTAIASASQQPPESHCCFI